MKIAVLVSGGVDSSLALKLLKSQGHDLTAFYLKIWLEDELAYLGDCPWQEDLSYVTALCEAEGVPLEVVSLQKEYWDEVVSYTIAEIKAGRTPNPDIFCNKKIKFGLFFDYLKRENKQFDKVASGHYAQVRQADVRCELLSAPDPVKDQTYFLSYLNQAQLAHIVFPIGHLNKTQVRELARTYNLPTKDRKDSQGICFLGKLKFSDFIKHYLGEQEGNLVESETGKLWGTHKGFWYYTVGQRQGLGLAGGPWYVVSKDCATNTVYISRNYYSPEKQRNAVQVEACNWIGQRPNKKNLQVKLRHGAHKHACAVEFTHDGATLALEERDQGIAPGQFAVFYDGDVCLGSGVIKS